jgi:HPt (histidine-containing phosphotransfer) domain-containing protein
MRSTSDFATGEGGGTAMGVTGQLMCFNRALALERVGGDEELLSEVGQLYLAEYPELVAGIRTALESGSADLLQRSAHTLKGSLSTLGAETAQQLAFQLEALGRAGRVDGAEPTLLELERRLEEFRQQLTATIS